ncbi:hypothetical protein BGZ82_008448 [Podila clonocystis]|nr:hypothetical protein BGZ82_008448 [Podila clonocystis]
MHLKTTLLALTAFLASAHALEANVEETNDASKLLIMPSGPYRPLGPFMPMYPGYYPYGRYPYGRYPYGRYPYSPFFDRTPSRLMPRHDDVTNILKEDEKSPKVIIEGHHQDPKLLFGGDNEKLLVDNDAGAEDENSEDENGESKFWNPYWWHWRRRGPWGPWGGPWGYPYGGRRRF